MSDVLHTKFGVAKLDNKGYYKIMSRKEGNNGKLFHRLLFEDFYGYEIPKGFVIHHKNENKQDCCILNLQLMSKSEHSSLHHKNRVVSEETREKLRKANIGKKYSVETKFKMGEAHKKHFATIYKAGFDSNGRQRYGVRRKGKRVKLSYFPSKLIDWFKEEYPDEVIKSEYS